MGDQKDIERRPDTIIIFPNDNKKHGKSPDFFGTVTWADGSTKEIVLWEKIGNKNNKFYTGLLKDPYEKEGEEKKPEEVTNKGAVDKPQNETAEDNNLDDLPF